MSRYGFIGLEDLAIKNMVKNHCLAKSISDAGWGQFVSFIEYKMLWTGGVVGKVDRFFPSTKTCSVCGCIADHIQLSDRTWTCLDCGAVLDRDQNAATNVLIHTVGVTEINALGDMITR